MQLKLKYIVTAVALVIICTACTLPKKPVEPSKTGDDPYTLSKPSHPIQLLFEGLKAGEVETIKKSSPLPSEYLGDKAKNQLGDLDLESPLIKTAAKILYQNLSYEITEIKQEGEGKAVATVAVVYPDISPFIKTAYQTHAADLLKQMLAGSFRPELAVKEILGTVAKEISKAKGISTLSQTITINCYKQGEIWQLYFDDTLLNVCSANALNAVKELDSPFLSK